MKIEIGPPNVIIPQLSKQTKSAAQPAGEAQPVKKPSDAFSLHISAAVERMKATSTEDDAIRRDKVDAIRNKLAAGTYNISGKDVANKILKVLKG